MAAPLRAMAGAPPASMKECVLKLYPSRLTLRPAADVSTVVRRGRGLGPDPAATTDLSRTTAAGVVWVLTQTLGGRAIGFLSQLVIAAVLDPRDFGVLGLTFTVTAFGGILVNFGIDSVLLQRHGGIRLWVVPALWATVLLGLLGALVVVVAGPVAATIYHSPALPLLASIVGLSMPLTAAGTVPMVILRARFAFAQIATINFFEVLGIQGLTILLAYTGWGALSFVIPLPVVAAARTIYLWVLTKPQVRGGWTKIRRAKYLVGRGSAVFATTLLVAMIMQGDFIALGLWANESVVGLYFFAAKLSSQPLLLMASSLSSVLLPTLSTLRNAPRQQGQAAIRAARILSLAIMPAALLQASLMSPAIHLFFPTHKWDESIGLMQVLSVGLGFNSTAVIAGTLLNSRGGFQQQLIYTALCLPVFFALVITGAWQGASLGVACAVAAYYTLVTPIYTYLIFRKDGMTVSALATLYLLPTGLGVAAVALGLATAQLAHIGSNIGQIASVTIVSAITYIVLLRVIDRQSYVEVETLVRRIMRRSR